MSLRFAALGSGSRGNALLVEHDDSLLLIDCGLPRREIERRCAELGRAASDITAVLVTHEHGDHRVGLRAFTRRYSVSVYTTAGTASALRDVGTHREISSRRAVDIGSIRVEPYLVPHDAREPCQFVFVAGGKRLGLLTDSGHVTSHMRERLADCDALALEFNHDPDALRDSAYPESLKARVASRYGHLSNAQSCALVAGFEPARLQWVAGLHLSETTNSPARVRGSFEANGLGERCPLHLATQHAPMAWLAVE